MTLQNSLTRSNIFRKRGICNVSVKLVFQAILLVYFIILYKYLQNDTIIEQYIPDYGTFYNLNYYAVTNFTIAIIYIITIDIVLHLQLLDGLINRRPTSLSTWLCFAAFEFIFLQILLFLVFVGLCQATSHRKGIILVTCQIAIAMYMVYVMFVVYSARHGFILNKELNNRFSTFPPTATTAPSTPNTQHTVLYSNYNLPPNNPLAVPVHLKTTLTNQEFMY